MNSKVSLDCTSAPHHASAVAGCWHPLRLCTNVFAWLISPTRYVVSKHMSVWACRGLVFEAIVDLVDPVNLILTNIDEDWCFHLLVLSSTPTRAWALRCHRSEDRHPSPMLWISTIDVWQKRSLQNVSSHSSDCTMTMLSSRPLLDPFLDRLKIRTLFLGRDAQQ